jgi:putative aldouronate transport system substrate-binding protein
LREKYGLPPIKNTADLEAYFDAVLKNEGGKVIPLGTSLTQGLENFIVDPESQKTVYVTAGDGLYFKVIINSDNTVKLVTAGEDPTNIPNPDLQRKWYTKGYLEKDVMSQKDYMGLFKAGKFAAVVGLQNSVGQVYQETMKNIPGAKLEFASINPDLAARKQQALYSPFQAWNFACIPVSSKNADRAMMVFDWMFQDQKNHDLFELGKEGTDWVAVGSDKYKRPDGVDVSKVYNNTSAYELTWNPLFVRYDSNLPQSAVDVLKYAADINTWKKSPLAGFTFNAEPVKDLVAKCAPEAKSFKSLADVGLIDNYQAQVEQLNEKLKKLGLEEIRAEMKKQVEAFLKNNK